MVLLIIVITKVSIRNVENPKKNHETCQNIFILRRWKKTDSDTNEYPNIFVVIYILKYIIFSSHCGPQPVVAGDSLIVMFECWSPKFQFACGLI